MNLFKFFSVTMLLLQSITSSANESVFVYKVKNTALECLKSNLYPVPDIVGEILLVNLDMCPPHVIEFDINVQSSIINPKPIEDSEFDNRILIGKPNFSCYYSIINKIKIDKNSDSTVVDFNKCH